MFYEQLPACTGPFSRAAPLTPGEIARRHQRTQLPDRRDYRPS